MHTILNMYDKLDVLDLVPKVVGHAAFALSGQVAVAHALIYLILLISGNLPYISIYLLISSFDFPSFRSFDPALPLFVFLQFDLPILLSSVCGWAALEI